MSTNPTGNIAEIVEELQNRVRALAACPRIRLWRLKVSLYNRIGDY